MIYLPYDTRECRIVRMFELKTKKSLKGRNIVNFAYKTSSIYHRAYLKPI